MSPSLRGFRYISGFILSHGMRNIRVVTDASYLEKMWVLGDMHHLDILGQA